MADWTCECTGGDPCECRIAKLRDRMTKEYGIGGGRFVSMDDEEPLRNPTTGHTGQRTAFGEVLND